MKTPTILGASALAAATVCAAIAFGEPTKAVLTARQLGVEELDLDLDLEDPAAGEPVAPAAAVEPVVDAAEEAAEEALPEEEQPVVDLDADLADPAAATAEAVEETVENVAEAAPAVEETVEDVAEAAPAVEETVEDVAEAAPAVEETVEEAVEDVAEAAPAVEETVEEAVEDVAEATPVVEETVEEAAEETVEEVAEAAPVAEEAVEEAVEDIDIGDLVDEEPVVVPEEDVAPVVEEEAPVVEEEAPVLEEDAPVVEEAVPVVEDVVEDTVADDMPVVEDPAPEVLAVSDPALEEEVPEVAAAAPAAAPGDADYETAKMLSEIDKLEEVRRKVLIRHGQEKLEQGKASLQVGNWQRAIEQFEDAIKFLKDKADTHEQINEASRGIGEAYYRIAADQVERRDYVEAEKSCLAARGHQHPKAADLLKTIREFQTTPPPPPPVPHRQRVSQEEWRKAQADISTRLSHAREFFSVGEYGKCREHVELILHDYPWCEDALEILRRLDGKETRYFDKERITYRDEMVGAVGRAWAPHTYGVGYTSGGETISSGGGEESDKNKPTDLSAEMRIREKLDRIILPEVNFRQANIEDVILELGDIARENDDPDIPAEERGVNFVLDVGLTGGGAASAPASDDPWGSAAPEPVATTDNGVPPLTMKVYNQKLSTALDLIMEMSNLKYMIRDNVVMVMPKNKASTDLQLRMYNVLPTIDERVAQLGSARASGSGDQTDPFSLQGGTISGTTDWKAFFSKLGVSWPDESTVTYMAGISKLVVKNTAANLAILEKVLAELNVTPYQVEIEVRFVEIGQMDLNSLGLEWQLNDDWEILENKADASLDPRSRRRIIMNSGSINGGFNYLNNNEKLAINNGSPIADDIAKFTSVLTNPELSLVLHALANRANTDLLSAPKVVAQTGNEAVIKTVVEYIYPTEYDVEMLESSNNNNDSTTYTGAVVEPQNFTMREVGIILKVTPRVSPDGSRITLDLAPTVVSDPTWKNYGSEYPVYGDENILTGQRQVEYVRLNMEQPFFPVRSIATSVDIYNGSTVVMGGMIREERYTEEDKIPILGDIPVLGHLFRYKSEQSDKRNLLIFVSARLVDPAGRDIRNSGGAGLVGGSQIEEAAR